jgi:hypothetical protein
MKISRFYDLDLVFISCPNLSTLNIVHQGLYPRRQKVIEPITWPSLTSTVDYVFPAYLVPTLSRITVPNLNRLYVKTEGIPLLAFRGVYSHIVQTPDQSQILRLQLLHMSRPGFRRIYFWEMHVCTGRVRVKAIAHSRPY